MWNIFLKVLEYDLLSTLLTHTLSYNYSQKCRWFMLHTLSNLYIVCNSVHDLKSCLENPKECSVTQWNQHSYNTFYMCTCLHIYHILFFQLTRNDIIHHGIMLGVCGPLCFSSNNIATTASLFFLSGLPGFLDYLVLWTFKTYELNKYIQKRISILINLLLRSPGCLIMVYINMLNYTPLNMITSMILYWNAQYYLDESYKSYFKLSSHMST